MENKKVRKRSEVKEIWDGTKYTKLDLILAAKPERDRKRDRMFLIFVSLLSLILALFGRNDVIKTSGILVMFACSLLSIKA
ncbi:hypothetical protein [Anaerococcus hydrogenalis]|uniref:Uncharacterized protein n=1 Tax=Anaerococcus hydrogenalis ACS-025-V-Sch4 TaxID=879306 RepID=F0H2F9_9FIRM|nr:hypothetical protein [Anaerococcus hydrogenalis]EGC83383.1 hypothetical protein HMPREF9246_0320 [Anaerococcus hydrogenalis ACS-025-V-Sch4]MBS5988877.1 hypothetical protein [Anaerococcus hydrogenalis]